MVQNEHTAGLGVELVSPRADPWPAAERRRCGAGCSCNRPISLSFKCLCFSSAGEYLRCNLDDSLWGLFRGVFGVVEVWELCMVHLGMTDGSLGGGVCVSAPCGCLGQDGLPWAWSL